MKERNEIGNQDEMENVIRLYRMPTYKTDSSVLLEMQLVEVENRQKNQTRGGNNFNS